MKKIIAVAALAAAMVTVPTLPTLAAGHVPPANCLIFPLLQAECRAMIMEHHEEMHAKMSTMHAPKHPFWWGSCEPAPEGSKYLLECE